MKYHLFPSRNIRSCRLICAIPISLICLTFYWISSEEPKQRVSQKAEVLFSSHIFESCPDYNYKWDDPEILKRLPPTEEEPLCHRENGITLLLRGEVKMNTEYLNYQKYKCKARCAYLDGGYEYKFGSWCTVGNDCKKFTCDFVYINCWLGEELVHIDVHLQIYEHRRNRAEEFRSLYNGHSIPLQSQVTSKGFHPNLYIIVLDSAGRNPAMRQLKKTYKYLVDELGAIDFEKFQRVAYSSRENAFAAFWGIIGERVDRKAFGGTVIEKTSTCGYPYDNRHYIQFEYEDAGYRTMYAYDYLLDLYMYVDCVGMVNDPATHHSRPFQLLSILPEEVWIDVPFVQYGYQYQDEKLLRKHLRNKTKCGQNYNHMIRYTEEFMNSYKGIPKFGILWTNEGHADERAFRNTDKYYEQFLRDNKKELDDAFVIVLGDHGQREGKVIDTTQGKFEVSNNLLLFSVPKQLRGTLLEDMVKKNSGELLTMHDLHATLIDIIRHQPTANFQGQSFLAINGTLGNSWLRRLDPNLPRSCRHLPIPSQYCTCNYGKHDPVSKEDSLWLMLPKLIQTNFNEYLAENKLNELCEEVIVQNVTIITKIQTGTSVNFHAEFYTTRSAAFSVDYKLSDNGELEMAPREFVRVNRYGTTGNCLTTGIALFKPVCYCKIQK
ncbi:unnamed protein product, partial [Mesorhabditis belari]|uniref:Uncharacterized protein n=1 Tax=Mesorhabditis belari TaxID=2138241 RepID=A0AAF3FRB5_9BILA